MDKGDSNILSQSPSSNKILQLTNWHIVLSFVKKENISLKNKNILKCLYSISQCSREYSKMMIRNLEQKMNAYQFDREQGIANFTFISFEIMPLLEKDLEISNAMRNIRFRIFRENSSAIIDKQYKSKITSLTSSTYMESQIRSTQ